MWQAWHLVTSTLISRGRRGTISHPRSFCVAGVALGDIYLDITRQAWHNRTSTVVLRGRRGTHGTGWRPWARFRRPWRPWRRATSAWQAWHLVTSTLISRGRRGTRSFCVAGVALGDIYLDITRQAWHNSTSTVVLRGTHGTGWRPWARFTRPWRPWRRATSVWQAWHLVTSTLISRGRRGTIAHPRSFCVAGVALMALGGALGPGLGARDARDAAPLLRGRRGTWWHPPWYHAAGVAQSHIHGRFAWQAWHSWHWVAPLGPV